jgi:hypothetical protein
MYCSPDKEPNMPIDAVTLEALRIFPGQLEAHYAAVPNGLKHWRPTSWDGVPSEALSALEQVCHVRDIEIQGYQIRIRRTLEETNPLLPSLDTDVLVIERDYASADAAAAMRAFGEARAKTVGLLSRVTPTQLDRSAVFEGYGAVTLRALAHFLCSHDQQHLAGLQWLLGKMQTASAR